jgi:hypothetical protein
MNNHISIPPTAADAYRAMLAEQTYASREEAAAENVSQLDEAKIVTLTVPFPGSNEDKIMAQAKTLGKTHGFTVLGGEYNRYDKTVDIELKGDLSKLAKFVNMWMRTDDSDEEILNDYSESYDSSIAEEIEAPDYGFASTPPKVKLKQLKAVIKKIPDNKVDYIVHVLARLANFEQIKEIMKGMSVKSN